MKYVRIVLDFAVEDEELLVRLADEAIAAHGGGINVSPDFGSELAQRAVELLLHSNPDIQSYDQYGLAYHSQECSEYETRGWRA